MTAIKTQLLNTLALQGHHNTTQAVATVKTAALVYRSFAGA